MFFAILQQFTVLVLYISVFQSSVPVFKMLTIIEFKSCLTSAHLTIGYGDGDKQQFTSAFTGAPFRFPTDKYLPKPDFAWVDTFCLRTNCSCSAHHEATTNAKAQLAAAAVRACLPACQLASLPSVQPGSQAVRQPGSQAARQPGSQAARQPGSQAARQPGSLPGGQPTCQHARPPCTPRPPNRP